MREYAQGDRKRAMQTWSEGSTASIVAALLAFNLGAANGDLSGITVGSIVGIVAQRSCNLTGCWLLPPTHVVKLVSQQQPLRASKYTTMTHWHLMKHARAAAQAPASRDDKP